ncbi:MmgE/PrpD family protein [Dongia sedimenti]|uniref:MmgE/PrpD family protein n=1 Tax=Dongia sedimenti TaxID=3064282 RepID=A0ABU0YFC4_9PROT|nr:MmgE/PrpD family protein [Rhodospirillaceae bacterium R-7]
MHDRQAPQNGEVALCRFVADLQFADIPPRVIQFTKGLLIDWLGSTLAGKGAPQVEAIERFAHAMGPQDGPSTIVTSRRKTSPYFAAMVNAAASHVVEQDDVHNGSVFHPATVIFPAVLAVAEAEGKSGRDILTAAIAGYEVGIRIGEFLGRSHYQVFHTTGTAGTLAAAMAVGKLLGLDAITLNHALGSAGTQAAGLWEFLRDAADSKQLHTAKAASDGLMAAYLARDGFRGATRILEGKQGLAAGMSRDADPSRLTDGLGTRWATEETSFKWHAACRHTHPAADALQLLMQRENLRADDIAEVTCHVHQAAIDVLGPVTDPKTVHQAKFSMGTVLGLIAVHGVADLDAFERYALTDPRVAAFRSKVRMVRDDEVDALYPKRWVGKLTATSTLGRTLEARVDEPKGDPGNTLTPDEIEAKAIRLAQFRDGASADEMRSWITRVCALDDPNAPTALLPL